MKRTVLFLCSFLFLLLVPTSALADAGPKPEVHIYVEGASETVYATLLSTQDTSGPWRAKLSPDSDWQGPAPEDIHQKFKSYDVPEGYYYLNFAAQASPETFVWSYYPPQDFRILLYLADSDQFLLSEPQSMGALINTFNVTLEDGRIASVTFQFNWIAMLSKILVLMLVTLVAELLIALLFRIPMKFRFPMEGNFRHIVRINLITQLVLNVLLWLYIYRIGQGGMADLLKPILLLPAEIIVFTIEALYYRKKLTQTAHPVLYALAANMLSFGMGLMLP